VTVAGSGRAASCHHWPPLDCSRAQSQFPQAELEEQAATTGISPNASGAAGRGPFSNNEVAALIKDATGEEASYTTIWKLRNGQAQNPQKRLIEALARTFGVPPAFFFDDYSEQAGLLREQVELLALVRDARISSAQLRAILELSPQARQAITDLVQATARGGAGSGNPRLPHLEQHGDLGSHS
jgi:transcriptional regulator with XRE-family HTH domain